MSTASEGTASEGTSSEATASEAPASEAIRVAVAIPTFRRPEQLARMLQVLPSRLAEVADAARVRVLIIDNDPQGGAEPIVAQAPAELDCRYVHEPRPGIAAARQRALDAATDYDLLAFIDDDETPRPGWLGALLDTWRRTGAAAVAGHVHTEFPADAEPWVVASGLFVRPLRGDGERLPAAGAGNLLLDLAQVRAAGIRFDTSLGLFGGEDTLFTRQLVRAGMDVVACPASVADDPLEPSRATRRFALARARHHGQMQAVIDLRLAGGRLQRVGSRLRNAVKGVGWIGRGALRIVGGMLRRALPLRATGARQVRRGIGMLEGALGFARPEYARGAGTARSMRSRAATAVRSASPVFRSVTGVRTAEPVVVLTLDDGPDPEWTPKVLDLLASRQATATFFVLLSRTRRHPELLQRIVAEGHEIAFHGADHRRLTGMALPEARRMLRDGRRELETQAGVRIRWYRPPYGALSPATWQAVRAAELTPVLWGTSALDGRDASHTERIERATAGIAPGTVVLAHDARAGVDDGVDDPAITPFDRAALLAAILDEYDRRGLRVVSLGAALRRGRPRRRMVLVG